MKALVIVARGMQLSAVSAYGNPWIESPALDALAAEGVVFDQHFAGAADRRAAPGADLLAALRQRGVTSHLIADASRPESVRACRTGSAGPGGPPRLDEGWDSLEVVEPQEDQPPLETTLYAVQNTLNELRQRDDWLLWVEFATLLPPWEPPEEYQRPYFEDEAAARDEDESEEADGGPPLQPVSGVIEGPIDPDDDELFVRLQSSYAAALTYLDGGVGRILDSLDEILEQTLVVVTTDTGQSLGEHGVVGVPGVHEENVHLPLMVRLPGADAAGRHVAALTQAADMAPTLADVFEVPLPDARGFTLLPLVYGDAEKVRDFACAWLPGAATLRTPEWALVLPELRNPEGSPRPPQLFVKPDDRWEVNDVAQHHPELVDELEKKLREFLTAAADFGTENAFHH
jgi:arylsulfatase A-like enzyme